MVKLHFAMKTSFPDSYKIVLTMICIVISISIIMKRTKSTARRITANLPEDLLDEALETTGQGITETLIQGLQLVRRSRAYDKGMALKGRLNLDLNLETLRERTPR